MLSINNLYVSVAEKEILKGLNLQIKPGEVHAIMGPNGSGKSTLAHVLAGKSGYEVTAGEIIYNGKNLLDLSVEERAWAGVFLALQYPVEIPGVSNANFLKTAINNIRKAQGLEEMDAAEFLKKMREKMALVEMSKDFVQRSVNEGFSGGEKKRNEVMQMLMLEPQLAVLDETDSGLDIDALQIVAKGVNALRHPDRSILMITHYQRLLDYIVPDYIHVLVNGKIIHSGDKTLALKLEKEGYGWLVEGAE